MINKVYIWNDISLINKNANTELIKEKLIEIKKMLKDSVEILDDIEKEYKMMVKRLNNIVTIGTRPNLFLNKKKKIYNISSKRIIGKDGFADDCEIDVDIKVYKMKNINIIEDIIVSGTTMKKVLENLYKNNPNVKINIYFLIGYEHTIKELKNTFNNLNVYCFNILKERAISDSTCMFLSDILYEKLGEYTYIEHIRKLQLFKEKTEPFITKIKEIRDCINIKVGIVTITIGINYGNRLQNYALQNVLNKLGVEAITFENIYQEKSLKKKIQRYFELRKKNRIFKLKLKRFKDFNDKYIKIGEKIKSYYVPPKLSEKYDYFICGSDQIWNPYYSGNTGTNFLDFVPSKKTIAYAPSFGTADIPEEKYEEFKKYLNHIKYLSCREEQGIKLIKNLTARDAKLVLDPTLLLSKDEWKKIVKKPKYIPNNEYIVTYFLGNQDEEYKKYINKVAEKNNLQVFDIMDMSDIEKFSTNPSEFIYLIENSELICTDSFHGTVFSIIFNKPYVLFERKSNMQKMNSRFESLKNVLELPERNYTNLKDEEIFNLDYDSINKNLKLKKQESIEYLKDVLNIWE